ncbi:50S ribosomal protein L19e [archaeon]|jgi:large subunit ribosomal protein L19e|nr:50S ribosomal protein L19e [archaeon]MBT4023065.1 50S ribosomal protein L19e [archaeon]MBT4272463.1 50S ribosomal protein L19e [archaeon]MBT4460561.1 50S ribosomal protein L19e [archaeon]MBT4857849.1 50S ribosomal protein L19e [archaeon]
MKIQKKLAGKIAKRSPKRVKIDPSRSEEIKEAITRADVRALIKDKAIKLEQAKGISRVRAKKTQSQKAKGRRKGYGSRKGTANARLKTKKVWMNKVRLQRKFLKELKEKQKLSPENYKSLYRKSKGGFFRSKRHIKLYITEHKMMN